MAQDDFFISQFADARAAGDEEAMRRWWSELVTWHFPRIEAMIAAEAGDRLSPDEKEEALERVLEKLCRRMVHTFNGSHVGEFVNALRTLIKGICIDVQRSHARSREKDRLTHTNHDGDEYENTEAADAHAKAEAARAELEDELAELADQVAHARSLLPDLAEKRGNVLALTMDNVPVEEIMQQLDMTRDAVYQARTRGLKDLAKLMTGQPT